MGRPKGEVSVAFARILSETLGDESKKLSKEDLAVLNKTQNKHDMISIEVWIDLLNKASVITADDAIGLRVGQQIKPHHLELLGYALIASGSVQELLQRYARYQCTIVKGFPMVREVTAESTTLSWAPLTATSMFQANVCTVTAMLSLLRYAIDDLDFIPKQIGFMAPPPNNIDDYIDVLGPNLSFDNEVMSFSITNDILGKPLVDADKNLVSILHAQLECLLPDIDAPPGPDFLRTKMQHAIGERLATSIPSIGTIASDLGMSKRTLSRRLKCFDTSFKVEMFTVQEQLAKSYLEENNLPLSEIAFLVGFQDQSSFTRAFKRWTNQSPKYWQKVRRD